MTKDKKAKKSTALTRERSSSKGNAGLRKIEERLDRLERVGAGKPPHSQYGGIFSGTNLSDIDSRGQLELADWAGNVFRALSSIDAKERQQALEALEDKDHEAMEWLQRSQVSAWHVAEAAALGPASRLNILNWLRSEELRDPVSGMMLKSPEEIRTLAMEYLKTQFPGGPPVAEFALKHLATVEPEAYACWHRRTWTIQAVEPVAIVVEAARELCADYASMDG